jgi:hypothetical protein
MLGHGLLLTLRRFRAVLWTYAINLGLAVLFSLRLHNQLSALTAHSLAAQRLTNGFDLGSWMELQLKLGQAPSGGTASQFGNIPLYIVFYFLLVPGTLYCYRTGSPARLSTLLHSGLLHFWRFVRITLCSWIAAVCILGPLLILEVFWNSYVDRHFIERGGFILKLASACGILLVAAALRLYFDFVEVYTVELGLHLRVGGRRERRGSTPDRRIRRTFGPAFRTLRAHGIRAYGSFVFLALLGFGAVAVTARIAMHKLGQPHVFPMFLLAQAGLFSLLFTRFWQRGAQTILAIDYPITPGTEVKAEVEAVPTPFAVVLPSSGGLDPIPDPEPASPSMPDPDPGIYRPHGEIVK